MTSDDGEILELTTQASRDREAVGRGQYRPPEARSQLCHECGHPISQHDEARGCLVMVLTPFGADHLGGGESVCLCYLTPDEAASPPGAQPERTGT